MSSPRLLQRRFTGMYRDRSRDDLPEGKVWNLSDYIPDLLGAPLRKRGGWEYHGSLLTSLDAAASHTKAVIYAPFSSVSAQVVGLDAGGKVFDLTNSVDRGDTHACGQPVFYRDLVIIPKLVGDAAPYKYTGSGAPASLGGSPPNGKALVVYKDRLGLGGSSSTPNRIYFSAAANPESWDTTNRWVDTSSPVVAMAALRNVLIVFHAGSVERIRGSIPPGSPATDMTLEPLYGDVGLFDQFALAVADDKAYFLDESGVYSTDGVTVTDLTAAGGLSGYWRDQFVAAGSNRAAALGVWRGYVFVSLMSDAQANAGTYVDFLVFEIKTRSWFRFANILAHGFGSQFGSTDELYFANRESKKFGKLSAVFSPASGVKNDADGDAVAPVLETPVYDLGSFYLKQFTDIYLNYDVRDASSDNPTLTVSYLSDPAETSFTSLSSTLAETTTRTRARLPLNQTKYGVALKVAQSNASSDTRLYGIEADVSLQEGTDLV